VTLAGQRVLIQHRVTTIDRHAGGEWTMVHHHTDSSEVTELVGQCQGIEGQSAVPWIA
jgi:hypothetical protein